MIIYFILSLLFLAFIIVVVIQPDEFRVTRVITIAAPPEKIFPEVENLHSWEKWSSWLKLDPGSRIFFEGAEAGDGSYMRWEGNYNKVGEGSMEVIESRQYEFIKMRIDFLKPLQVSVISEFTFSGNSGVTEVSWKIHGQNSFITKAMALFMNCEKIVGRECEKRLSSLKSLAEHK